MLALLGAAGAGRAQPAPPARYWVTLRDKNGVSFQPEQYFTPAARARRARQHLPAADFTDRPVRADYLAQVHASVDTLTLVSRWFNAVACRATAAQAAALRRLPGVLRVEAWPLPADRSAAARAPRGTHRAEANQLNATDYTLARHQTAYLGAELLRRAHLDGQGLRIAVLDVGFTGVDTHPAFAALRTAGRIVATHDFLKNQADVFRGGSHGTEVLGCLAGFLPPGERGQPGNALGLAPGAAYLLARTEQLHRERFAEEEAWLAAVEWADREGADIINSSLAYTEQRYFPEDMNGRRSLIARAANLAARKGMLVVSAAGNDGDDDWVRIGTPADADSALAVGGLDPETGLHLSFSSVGPTADRRLKPDVSAFGAVLTTTPRGYERLEGTSFSSPLVAGLAACTWQQHRTWSVMRLFRELRAAGELYPYYDYAHGYGHPQAAILLAENEADARPQEPAAVVPTFDFELNDSLVAVVLRPEASVRPTYRLPLLADQPERQTLARPAGPPAPSPDPAGPAPVGEEQPTDAPLLLPAGPDYPLYLYWHLADPRGVLHRYETRAVTQRLVLQVPRHLVRNGEVLRVHFRGYTGTYSE